MITFENAKQYKGKKIKVEFTKKCIEFNKANEKEIEKNNKWRDEALREVGFFEKYGLKGQKDVDFSTGIVTDVVHDTEYNYDTDEEEDCDFLELDKYKWVKLTDIEKIIEID